jgi:methylglyoxal synthase
MENNVTRLPKSDKPRPIVALVAHDRRKDEMVEWATFNKGTLSRCTIHATRTTGLTLQSALETPIQLMLSGPMGGDAQLGSMIAEGRIDAVFFFWDPLTPQPHDVDVKALLRLAVLYDVAIACNRSSADHIISSPLFKMPEQYRQDRGPGFVPAAR